MDQFRGYTVAAMVLVNFVGDFDLTPGIFGHHNTYLSYADTIMPAFHFAVGFALRLTLLRRLPTEGRWVYVRLVRRCLALILLSLVLTLPDLKFESWSSLHAAGLWDTLAGFMKCGFWGTLAIIGLTSLWVSSVIASSAWMRIAFLLVCAALYLVFSDLFYFQFMYARPNWLDQFWGARNVRGLDGGPLGFLAWCIPQLLGSLAYDAVARGPRVLAVLRLLGYGLLVGGLGYGLSCLSMLYPVTNPPSDDEGEIQIAAAPVRPPRIERLAKDPRAFLAPPPFVQPEASAQRQMNYWLMCKRVVSLPFILAASGIALVLYAVFVLLCDLGGLHIGVFRTFGQNALAAYVLHEMVARALHGFTPEDSPAWWILTTFALFAGTTYGLVRALETRGIFIRM
jgi:predicted acyltransferase